MPDVDDDQNNQLLVSRRGALVGGAFGVAAVVTAGAVDPEDALATTTAASLTATYPVPTTTAPEQLRLAWGADPTTEMTVSWSAPGTTPMPAPTLAYSTSPITAQNPGTVVALPTTATPLSLSAPRTGPSATSFYDNLSQQTTYHYHVPLTGLKPGTRYYYQVNDGAGSAPAGGQFVTAPKGRAPFRFTAFGDMGTPASTNPSGYYWFESSDTSIYTTKGVQAPADNNGAGLFHLMLADLSYANANPGSCPDVWRDYQVGVSGVSANAPWMPIQGNHELELGGSDAQGNFTKGGGTNFYNGPYGAGNYLARHLLPDNGLNNYDGTTLQGMFYSFQVGSVLFICLNTNDVVYQNPQVQVTAAGGKTPYAGTYPTNGTPNANSVTLAVGTAISQYQSTGKLAPSGNGIQLVPDSGSGQPNLQTQWLANQLKAARAPGSSVDMIVVCEHHCALSSGPNNGVDLAIRAAWLPLYDQYQVDLVIGGHDHDYERSFPVRGVDAPQGTPTAAFSNPWGTYYTNGTVDTRRPTVVANQPTTLASGAQAWDTGSGTVFLQLGGAGAIAGAMPNTNSQGQRVANIWATNQGVSGKACATEVATWSANYDSSDNFGYAVFDVDPGSGPGQTTIRYRWYQVPTVASGAVPTLSSTPYEDFVFTRFAAAGQVTVNGANNGSAAVGSVLSATPSGFEPGASYGYQWLRDGGVINGATTATYTVAAADAGHALTVVVTATAQSFPAATATSTGVSVPAAKPATPAPAPTPAPTYPVQPLFLNAPGVAGTPRVGHTLTAFFGVGPAGTLAYQWLRNGKAISGATKDTYLTGAADLNHSLSVKVTETVGSASTDSTSESLRIGAGSFTKAPTPTIDGKAVVGRTVTAEVGSWSPKPTFAYQWLLDGRAIHGATRKQLVVQGAWVGRQLKVEVIARHSGYDTHKVVSAPATVGHVVVRAATPRLSGKALVGETIQAHIGQWQVGTEFTYRWLANGRVIEGATGHALRVTSALRGARIQLEVTGQVPGHDPVRALSRPTGRVRRPWTLL